MNLSPFRAAVTVSRQPTRIFARHSRHPAMPYILADLESGGGRRLVEIALLSTVSDMRLLTLAERAIGPVLADLNRHRLRQFGHQ